MCTFMELVIGKELHVTDMCKVDTLRNLRVTDNLRQVVLTAAAERTGTEGKSVKLARMKSCYL